MRRGASRRPGEWSAARRAGPSPVLLRRPPCPPLALLVGLGPALLALEVLDRLEQVGGLVGAHVVLRVEARQPRRALGSLLLSGVSPWGLGRLRGAPGALWAPIGSPAPLAAALIAVAAGGPPVPLRPAPGPPARPALAAARACRPVAGRARGCAWPSGGPGRAGDRRGRRPPRHRRPRWSGGRCPGCRARRGARRPPATRPGPWRRRPPLAAAGGGRLPARLQPTVRCRR